LWDIAGNETCKSKLSLSLPHRFVFPTLKPPVLVVWAGLRSFETGGGMDFLRIWGSRQFVYLFGHGVTQEKGLENVAHRKIDLEIHSLRCRTQ
jgi:hypothetical protein